MSPKALTLSAVPALPALFWKRLLRMSIVRVPVKLLGPVKLPLNEP